MTVSATMDHAHVSPPLCVQPRQDLREDVLERGEDAADDHVRAFREPLPGNTV